MKAAIHAAGFSVIPYGLMDSQPDYKLWAIYACLYRHGWNSADGCFASVPTISRETGICEKVVQRGLSTLVTQGWIGIEIRPGRSTVYRMKLENLEQKGPQSKMTRVKNAPGTPGKNAPPTRSKNAPLTRSQEQEPINKNPLLKLQSEFAAVSEPAKPRTKTKGDPAFELFWKTYLAAPVRAASQSKPKALTQWQKTIRTEAVANLQQALETEISHQHLAAGTFVSPLPDCFRWLRDQRYLTVNDRPINTTNYIPDVIR